MFQYPPDKVEESVGTSKPKNGKRKSRLDSDEVSSYFFTLLLLSSFNILFNILYIYIHIYIYIYFHYSSGIWRRFFQEKT